MHLVEQVLLYRTANAIVLVHSNFLIDYFRRVYFRSALPRDLVDHIKFVKCRLIPTESDAAFHEESEYVISFKIQIKTVRLSSLFR